MSFGRRAPCTRRSSPSLATGSKFSMRSSCTHLRFSWQGNTRPKRSVVWGIRAVVAIATTFTFHAWAGPR
eukprot:3492243-Pleurochrysis_carterae.AAC.1